MTAHPFPQLAARVFNTPIALHPAKAEVIMAAVAERLGIATINGRLVGGSDLDFDDDFGAAGSNPRLGYDIVEGVALIQIHGTLVQRLGSLRPYSGMTGYNGIRENFLTAMVDPAVRAIALDIDSPGGEVSGCFDLVDTIAATRGVKPIRAILSENAYSAAYALATAADRITVPRTGGTGSVGVIYMHISYEAMLKQAGVAVTLVTKGDLKGEGNEFQDLSADAFARLKADVMSVGDLFDRTVAANRKMTPAAVNDTQAGTFLGAAGVAIGFADEVLAPDQAFLAFLDDLG